ncbi:MAG: membrane integrity-associated transporter subunit PqiC [Betaproteobacteria bacterium]|nr:membrane integrity-associated transporter subunit PqiC [Betaproteobacteria bacterium]
MKTLFLILLGGVLAACSLPGKERAPVTRYVLTDPGPVVRSTKSLPGVLLVREMETSDFYQDTRLAFSREPATRGHYQYAYWTEAPARRLTWLLRQRLESGGGFGVVDSTGSGIAGDYQLNTRLIDFFHDASVPPGTALVVLEAELVKRASGRLAARRVFAAQQAAVSHDARGAAEALGRAANRVMDELVVWLPEAADAPPR